MSDDMVRAIYKCGICHRQYNTKKRCEQCVKSHESSKHCCEIELSFYMGNSHEYCFHERKFILPKDGVLNGKIDIFCFYGGYPRLMVECLDTPEEILKAKKRLIQAAYEWAEKYRETVAGLEKTLKESANEH